MNNFPIIEDPWAGDSFSNNTSSKTEKEINKIGQLVSNIDVSDSNGINIFGESLSSSSILESVTEPNEILAGAANNNWGDYNSFNILSHNSATKSANTASTQQPSTLNKNSATTNATSMLENISQSLNITEEVEGETYSDEENDEGLNEYELTNSINLRIWTEEEVKKFNPLTLKNSRDGLSIRVREIPEKEGLVFKHINYLISHTIKYSEEYAQSNNDRNKVASSKVDNETKVIRRYSDFAWLVDVLWKKYPFRLIPELPPKKFALASANDALFLQKRRRGLQRFLFQLCKHPILSKENLVIMFLTVPNDFSNWKKFANIELADEFDGIRVSLPNRFKIDLTDVLRGLVDNDSEYDDSVEIDPQDLRDSSNKNELVINNINQVWNESPIRFKDKDFITNISQINEVLSKLAELWSKLYILVERIEKREIALAADHQRFSLVLENIIKVDGDIFGMDNLVSSLNDRVDDETQNMNIINSMLHQVSKYFTSFKHTKEGEMININTNILENWRIFQDYLISFHFLIERFCNFKNESEKELRELLNSVIKSNEKIKQLKMKSDIRGIEVDRYVNMLIKSMDQLNMLISKIFLAKTTFINEFKIFQKVKYLISEVLQDWFNERSQYFDKQNDLIQNLVNELKDIPLSS